MAVGKIAAVCELSGLRRRELGNNLLTHLLALKVEIRLLEHVRIITWPIVHHTTVFTTLPPLVFCSLFF